MKSITNHLRETVSVFVHRSYFTVLFMEAVQSTTFICCLPAKRLLFYYNYHYSQHSFNTEIDFLRKITKNQT